MFYGRFPRKMNDAGISLRPLRLRDCPFLQRNLRDADILSADGLELPATRSWVSLWWWLKKTYALSFVIRLDSRRIGFIGICNLMLGESAEMSLVICGRTERHRGYGSRAFSLIEENLNRHHLTEKILVRVRRDNHEALSFWRKCGFQGLPGSGNTLVMGRDMGHHRSLFSACRTVHG
ncbi:MAG TPA: GNAT family N-acetyltransferase [Thermodesulfovibrionales bacterium]|nr:GNAT family N-acetyltransferase [Thermodesulfovibrionales bacterium]